MCFVVNCNGQLGQVVHLGALKKKRIGGFYTKTQKADPAHCMSASCGAILIKNTSMERLFYAACGVCYCGVKSDQWWFQSGVENKNHVTDVTACSWLVFIILDANAALNGVPIWPQLGHNMGRQPTFELSIAHTPLI